MNFGSTHLFHKKVGTVVQRSFSLHEQEAASGIQLSRYKILLFLILVKLRESCFSANSWLRISAGSIRTKQQSIFLIFEVFGLPTECTSGWNLYNYLGN